MNILFLLLLNKHGSEICIITNSHPFISPIVVFVFYFIKQTPRIWAANFLSKFAETPITIHWQRVIETSFEFPLILCIEDVPVPSNVHEERKPQLHLNPQKT